ncbi:hypothetical protein AKJ42_00055 [candidate division MSBL1 archaeon SCGC-AAA261C02]|uniref:Methyltransferase type 11 domain-containing protein n=1 Tax=candidate division MSBL1 archaeon SCGC-AAA261C02 TaxID=1698272 RepID=A0A133V2D1_9EURY|nr:hypothetical protein AKJ42_00055 [candidate division MSBL1 archaeon SCGC-AAA261C02]
MNELDKKRELKNRYDETADIYNERYRKIQRKKFQAVRNHLQGADRVLDVGCGTGLFLNEFSKISGRVVGVDFSLGMLRKTEKTNGISLVCADADKLPFRDESFNVVISLTLLQNMPDPQHTVREMGRVVVEDGLVLLTTLEKKHSISQLEEWVSSANLKPMRIGRIPDSEDILCVARRMK